MDKKTGGRSSRYRPEHCEEARRRCANGAIMAELAELFRIEPRTLTSWRKQYPELNDAIQAGRADARRSRKAGGPEPRRRGSAPERRYTRVEFVHVRP